MKNTGNIAFIICIALTAWLVIDKLTASGIQKIGVVQMEKLVYDFKGMKDATQNYTGKLEKWKTQADSLEGNLKALYNQIRLDSLNKDKTKLDKDIRAFMLFKQSYNNYQQAMQEKAGEEDKKMTLGVINQIHECMKLYAEKKGYDMILCNSEQQQNIGYSKTQMDITKEVLEFANNHYEGLK